MDAVTLTNTVMGILNQFMPFLGGIGGAIATGAASDMAKKQDPQIEWGIGGAIATGAASDVGDTIYQKGKEQGKHLFEAIRDRFSRENDSGGATRALQSLTAGDPDYGSVVQTKLERLLRDDPGFADNLLEIIRSGPLQSLIVGEEATAREIDIYNALGAGTQKIQTGKGSQVEGVSMNIAPPEKQ